ncbi:MAG: hypothetical protein AAF623_21760, partial [Planctomycetota bacterium]
LGIFVCVICIPMSLIAIMGAALFSESKKGQLAVEDNRWFRFCEQVLIFCLVNLLCLMLAKAMM